MWDCPKCGCRCIAAPLTTCPMCFEERDDVATCTTGGASNANALPGETGYVPPEVPEVPEVAAVAGEAPEADGQHAEVAVGALAEPAPDVKVPEAAEPAKAVSAAPPAKADPKPTPVKPAGPAGI